MLLGTLGVSLLGNILSAWGINKEGRGINRAKEGAIATRQGWGVYSRDNLPDKIKDGAYIINLDDYSDIGSHWVALYVSINDVTYSDSFGEEHIPKEIKKFIGNKNIKTNIFRIQPYDSIMCGYFCIGFINFMLAVKTSTVFTNLFSPNDFKKDDDIILKHFYD